MILRRVIEHFRKQEWTAIFLDFLIVVVGVFIGIQVSNWNAARQERALERQYLERLHDDFRRSIENAEANIAAMERQFRLEGLMVDRLKECRLHDDARRDFATGIYLVGRLEPPPLVRGAIDELRSTGRIGILRSLELRRKLSDVVREQENNAEVLDYIVARATPHIVYIDARVILDQPKGGFENVAEKGVSPERVVFDFEALCKDPLYVGAVSTLQEVTRVVISHNAARLADYRVLVSLLEAELGWSQERPL